MVGESVEEACWVVVRLLVLDVNLVVFVIFGLVWRFGGMLLNVVLLLQNDVDHEWNVVIDDEWLQQVEDNASDLLHDYRDTSERMSRTSETPSFFFFSSTESLVLFLLEDTWSDRFHICVELASFTAWTTLNNLIDQIIVL